jgi:uncharacterized membrane protein YdjX (TVP38/TMEM64 family)
VLNGHRLRNVALSVAALIIGVLVAWPFLAPALDMLTAALADFPGAAEVAARIRGWGAWGVLGSIALMILHSFIPFPAEILAVANGLVFGAFWGSVVTWTGAMLGAYAAFGLARWLGEPFVRRMLSPERRSQLERWSLEEGGLALLAARLVPVIAFNLINYAAGLTRIRWWTFSWATGIGILPLTVLMAALGDGMMDSPWWFLFLVIGVVALMVMVFRGFHTRAR